MGKKDFVPTDQFIIIHEAEIENLEHLCLTLSQVKSYLSHRGKKILYSKLFSGTKGERILFIFDVFQDQGTEVKFHIVTDTCTCTHVCTHAQIHTGVSVHTHARIYTNKEVLFLRFPELQFFFSSGDTDSNLPRWQVDPLSGIRLLKGPHGFAK